MRLAATLIALVAMMFGSGCAHRPADDPADPLEPINRAMFRFNETADKYALRPVAKVYADVTPAPARTGITNFFDNVAEPRNIVNALLQGKFTQAGRNLGRLLLNTTAGLGGFIDVAAEVGIPKHVESFGQTLGTWGVGEGWYLMLPLLGPSTNRDLVGFVGDSFVNPSFALPGRYDVYVISANAVDLVNTRANLLPADGILAQQFDRYLFVRTAYLQQRWSLIHDGNPPLEDLDLEDFEDDAEAGDAAAEPAAPVAN